MNFLEKIGIAGVGGIGSNVAMLLVRSGITRLKIVDFDLVELSNLNRQFYSRDQVGHTKVEVLAHNLLQIQPYAQIETSVEKITAENCREIFADCPFLVEGLDQQSDKKMLLEQCAQDHFIVSACGIAGDRLGTIQEKRMGNCYIYGDFATDCTEIPVLAHKVAAVAAQMTARLFERNETEGSLNTHNKLPAGIYGITAEKFSCGRDNISVVKAMIAAGVKIIQYREKRPAKSFRQMLVECQSIRKLSRETGVLFIVNDYPDIAQLVDADGVHIGQDDFPVHEVRRLLGKDKVIGLSTHTIEQAKEAVASGADYIGVGPIFATQTKEDVCAPVGFEYLDYVVANIPLPFVAIGGIKQHNIKEVVQRGAKTLAVVTEIVGAKDIEKTACCLQAICLEYQ